MKTVINVVYNKMYCRSSLGFFNKTLAVVLGIVPMIVLILLVVVSCS